MYEPIKLNIDQYFLFVLSTESEPKVPAKPLDDAGFKCIQDTNLGRDKNSLQFWDFVERWRANRALKKLDSSSTSNGLHSSSPLGSNGNNGNGGPNGNSAGGGDPSSVSIGGSGRSDVKRYGNSTEYSFIIISWRGRVQIVTHYFENYTQYFRVSWRDPLALACGVVAGLIW